MKNTVEASSRQEKTATVIFWTQIIGGIVLCEEQFFRLIKTTNGQIMTLFILSEFYLASLFLLALNSYRKDPSPITRQVLYTYIFWIVAMGTQLLAFFVNGHYVWSSRDTQTLLMASTIIAMLFVYMTFKRIPMNDPMFKGMLGITGKAFPQVMMAFEVVMKGGAGVPAWAIVIGNITASLRVIQIWLSIREADWDRNRGWMFASELLNELTWIGVTVVWLIWLMRS